MTMKYDESILNIPTVEILKSLLGKDTEALCELFLRTTFFISPEKVWERSVIFPNCVRTSKEHHPGKSKGDKFEKNGIEYRVWDNKKARDAFSSYSKKKLNGSGRNVDKGWEVAHIWGRVYDPTCFTAGWNICLIPNFLRDLTEEQNDNHFFQNFIKQISYDYFFKPENSKIKQYEFIKSPGINLKKYIGELEPHFL